MKSAQSVAPMGIPENPSPGGVPEPAAEGRPRIARRFSAGKSGKPEQVPEGRLRIAQRFSAGNSEGK